MPNRLAGAISPYLRSHAGNPVDWWEWGEPPFAEAARRQVPVIVSIGYSTCHWCHVMARESFSDPVLAEYLNEKFVPIKVDREEYPDVDASYLAAAGAFTENLGWPLTVFVTPDGKPFYAGTYWPPTAVHGRPAFRDVLAAVDDAWMSRRDEVEANASAIASALSVVEPSVVEPSMVEPVETVDTAPAVALLLDREDPQFGGFGSAPKFPVATVLGFLLDRGEMGDTDSRALAERTLDAMEASDLRDADGGFFRYATQRDWSEPHYERMLYDNALLLSAYARARRAEVASGIASFLLDTMQLPGGGFASAQDSESTVDGVRVEGGYYALSLADRAKQVAPALDEKVLTGWNGLAIEALALAGTLLDRPEWIAAAQRAADFLLEHHVGETLVRASIGDRVSSAKATLEDYGMLAGGLLQLALSNGEVRYAVAARKLVDDCLGVDGLDGLDKLDHPFAVPGGPDALLASHGMALASDPSEGAYPSGASAMAAASHRLFLLTAEPKYLVAARHSVNPLAVLALQQPIAFGAALGVLTGLSSEGRQLVVVSDDAGGPVASLARTWRRPGAVFVVVSSAQSEAFAMAGFELFEGRVAKDKATAYYCKEFVCALPVTTEAELTNLLGA